MWPNYHVPLWKGSEFGSNCVDNAVPDNLGWCSCEVVEHLGDDIVDFVLETGFELSVSSMVWIYYFDLVIFLVFMVKFFDELRAPVGHKDSLEKGVGGLDHSGSVALHVIYVEIDQSRKLSALEEE